MKILITGGAGYLGTELVRQLAPREDVSEVVVYDDLSRGSHGFFLGPKLPAGKVRLVAAALLDTRSLRKEVRQADVVVHLAARVATPFANQDPHEFEQVNHWGTAELVYAVEESSVSRLLFVSSASVYGTSQGEPLTEETPPAPSTHYAISKHRGEQHVWRLREKLPTLILRCGNVFGLSPAMRFDSVINKFAREAHFQGRIAIHGNGRQSRPFLHVAQAGRALAALCTGGRPSAVLNLVDRNLSVLEIVEAIRSLYPHLELMYVNQHLTMRNLEVAPSPALLAEGLLAGADLGAELGELRDAFSI